MNAPHGRVPLHDENWSQDDDIPDEEELDDPEIEELNFDEDRASEYHPEETDPPWYDDFDPEDSFPLDDGSIWGPVPSEPEQDTENY